MTCEHAQQITVGGGSRSERLRAKLHLRRCATCRAAAQETRAIAQALATAPPPAPPESLVAAWREGMPEAARSRRGRRWGLALAPVVAIGLWLGAHHVLSSRSGTVRPAAPLAADGGRCLVVLEDPMVVRDVSHGSLAWFPDGRTIAYTTISDETLDAELVVHGTRRLWRIDLATGERSLLAEESGAAVIHGVQVAPAGGRLVYLDGRHLKVVDVQTGRQMVVPQSFAARRGAWSPDGTRLAFARSAGNDEFGRTGKEILADRGIWVWRVADGKLTKIVPFPEQVRLPGDGWFWGPHWSPDGEWLAFLWQTEERTPQADLFAYRTEIRIVHPDGSDLHTVATLRREGFDAGLLGSQCWSPDSRALVFSWAEALGEAKWEWSAEARSWVPPDGAYVDRGVATLDIDTGKMGTLVPPDALGPGYRVWPRPAWSPRGNAVAFVAREPDHRSSLYAVATSDGSVLTVAEGTEEARYSSPVWSPDGESLLYLKSIRSPGEGDLRAELWLTKIGEAE
jgi:Tol biopolymer transport system component